jgi:hypothetical protein
MFRNLKETLTHIVWNLWMFLAFGIGLSASFFVIYKSSKEVGIVNVVSWCLLGRF